MSAQAICLFEVQPGHIVNLTRVTFIEKYKTDSLYIADGISRHFRFNNTEERDNVFKDIVIQGRRCGK